MANKSPHIVTEATRAQVEAFSAVGTPADDIATMLGISRDTLDRRYADELRSGRIKANFQIARKIHAQALEGDTALLIWWSKTRMRWAAAVHDDNDSASTPEGIKKLVIKVIDGRKKPENAAN